MIVNCEHGFYTFYETDVGQISNFILRSGFSLFKKNNYFVFDALKDAEDFSIKGLPYLNAVSKKNYQGKIGEVFRSNDFVFDFTSDLIKDRNSVTSFNDLMLSGDRYVSKGLVLPGSFTQGGKKVIGYTCHVSRLTNSFTYSEVDFV